MAGGSPAIHGASGDITVYAICVGSPSSPRPSTGAHLHGCAPFFMSGAALLVAPAMRHAGTWSTERLTAPRRPVHGDSIDDPLGDRGSCSHTRSQLKGAREPRARGREAAGDRSVGASPMHRSLPVSPYIEARPACGSLDRPGGWRDERSRACRSSVSRRRRGDPDAALRHLGPSRRRGQSGRSDPRPSSLPPSRGSPRWRDIRAPPRLRTANWPACRSAGHEERRGHLAQDYYDEAGATYISGQRVDEREELWFRYLPLMRVYGFVSSPWRSCRVSAGRSGRLARPLAVAGSPPWRSSSGSCGSASHLGLPDADLAAHGFFQLAAYAASCPLATLRGPAAPRLPADRLLPAGRLPSAAACSSAR